MIVSFGVFLNGFLEIFELYYSVLFWSVRGVNLESFFLLSKLFLGGGAEGCRLVDI